MSYWDSLKEEFTYLKERYGLTTAILTALDPKTGIAIDAAQIDPKTVFTNLGITLREVYLQQQDMLFDIKPREPKLFVNTFIFLVRMDMDAQYLTPSEQEPIIKALNSLKGYDSWRQLYPILKEDFASRDGLLWQSRLQDTYFLLNSYLQAHKPIPLPILLGGGAAIVITSFYLFR
tara:strand:- start:383 stop:910 length:528 start_codon:yes stop_codon:yes gene_type:complete